MDSESQRIIEVKLLRKDRDRNAVATCARSLGVTGRTKIARRRRARAVLAEPVAFVDNMARRHHVLAG
jgi:hypothetical protein